MKLFLIILLIVLIMAIAKGVARQYKLRHNIFVYILKFINEYELNIGFKKEKIKSIIKLEETTGELNFIFSSYLDYLYNGKSLDLSNLKLLTEEEQKYLTDMFLSLGKADYVSEMAKLKIFKHWLEEKIEQTKSEHSKYYPLTVKLSFLFALGLALILL